MTASLIPHHRLSARSVSLLSAHRTGESTISSRFTPEASTDAPSRVWIWEALVRGGIGKAASLEGSAQKDTPAPQHTELEV